MDWAIYLNYRWFRFDTEIIQRISMYKVRVYLTRNESIARTSSFIPKSLFPIVCYDILRRCASSWPKFANEAQSRCLFDGVPPSLSFPFIILIVITADNASNERRVGLFTGRRTGSPEIDRAFHRRSGRWTGLCQRTSGKRSAGFSGNIAATWVHGVSFTRMEV